MPKKCLKKLPPDFLSQMERYVSVIRSGLPTSVSEYEIQVVLGGSTAWKMFTDEEFAQSKDRDVYFIIPQNKLNPQMFGLTLQDTFTPRPKESFDISGNYYQFKFQDTDFNFRRDSFTVYSNFQIGICVTGHTHEVYYDRKDPVRHERDFERFLNEKIIISYELDSLIEKAADNPTEHAEHVRILTFVLKSYISPLAISGMKFEPQTARAILGLESRKYRILWATLKKRLFEEPYCIPNDKLVNLFDVAEESLVAHEAKEKQDQQNLLKAAETQAMMSAEHIATLREQLATAQHRAEQLEEQLVDAKKKHEVERKVMRHELSQKEKQLHLEKSKTEEALALQEAQHARIEALKEELAAAQKKNELQKKQESAPKQSPLAKACVTTQVTENAKRSMQGLIEFLTIVELKPGMDYTELLAIGIQAMDVQYKLLTGLPVEARLAHAREFYTQKIPQCEALKRNDRKKFAQLLLDGLSLKCSDETLPPKDECIVHQCYANFLWNEMFSEAGANNFTRAAIVKYFETLRKIYPNVNRSSSLIDVFIDNLKADIDFKKLPKDFSHPLYARLCLILGESSEVLNNEANDHSLIDSAILEVASEPLFPHTHDAKGRINQKDLIDQVISILFYCERALDSDNPRAKTNIKRIVSKLYAPTQASSPNETVRFSQRNNNAQPHEPDDQANHATHCQLQ